MNDVSRVLLLDSTISILAVNPGRESSVTFTNIEYFCIHRNTLDVPIHSDVYVCLEPLTNPDYSDNSEPSLRDDGSYLKIELCCSFLYSICFPPLASA